MGHICHICHQEIINERDAVIETDYFTKYEARHRWCKKENHGSNEISVKSEKSTQLSPDNSKESVI